MSSTADLPDLNVWLALVWPEHNHHRQALKYWEHQASQQILFCTVTALGLVRLVCQPKLMGDAMKTPREASALLEAFCQQPGVGMAAAEHGGWEVFHQLVRTNNLPARLCTDTHLAALAMANGWRLVSFDQDFKRFEGLELLSL
ncbi:MAG: PIN domain-containing protein [Vulcanococcus sp.]|uniref:TA system VapC family ribonuclease toxin n=1 Tax=Vulcanococcus sp. TaxID=2856995 RepID=UPI0025CC251D|nr:TA system VapC family ribonuclease toxin [Vulcanococcus sp.]MBW0174372.1 PIN domain-containing protein [Vulcanococcus sp.]MBW0181028.1 PIN domain-containing protein [Vulcanococcus sp.]